MDQNAIRPRRWSGFRHCLIEFDSIRELVHILSMRMIDLVGRRYGRLTVLGNGGRKGRELLWLCVCDCGKEVVVRGDSLRNGRTKSCWCLHNEATGNRSRKHGESTGRKGVGSVEYRRWLAMRDRCRNPRNKHFKDYGGRGISVCNHWDSYENFLADMGRCPPGHSIDRVNNNGNYEPGNCRWATASEQRRNQRCP